MDQDQVDRIRASEGQHMAHDPAHDADNGQHPLDQGLPVYDKATVGWALACIAVLVGVIICAIAQKPVATIGGLQ